MENMFREQYDLAGSERPGWGLPTVSVRLKAKHRDYPHTCRQARAVPLPSDWFYSSSISLACARGKHLICLAPADSPQQGNLLPPQGQELWESEVSGSLIYQRSQRCSYLSQWKDWGLYLFWCWILFSKYFNNFRSHSLKMDCFFTDLFKGSHWVSFNISLIIQSHNHVHQWLH